MKAAAAELTSRFSKLSRTTEYDSTIPKLILNPDKTNFYDFTIDDFEMVDYNPLKPQIKLELGI